MFILEGDKQLRVSALSVSVHSGKECKELENSEFKPHLFMDDDYVFVKRGR